MYDFLPVATTMRVGQLPQQHSTGKLFKDDDDESYDKSFLRAVKPVIFIAQMFGLFPISGLLSNDPKKMRFSWISLRTLFSACFIVFSLIFTCLVLYRQVQAGPLTPLNMAGVIFFANSAIICIFFFKLAMKFSPILEIWRQVERNLRNSNFWAVAVHNGWSLRKRVIVCTSCSLTAAFIEHLMSLCSRFERNTYETKVCNWTRENSIEDFVTKHFYFTFSLIDYNHFYGFLAEYMNVSFTFYWNFLDIFLMIVSIGLSYNYEKINNRIKFFKERIVNDKLWAEVRSDYNQVTELLKFVDKRLDKMIVLACYNDGYHILFQFLNVSAKRQFVVDRIYFYYSITFLICRASGLFLFASSIYENAKKPLRTTRSIPNEGWFQEVERFDEQVHAEVNALSGMNFFYLTRSVLFGLAGTILTYEIVLLQYNTTEAEMDAWVNFKR